MNQSKNTDSKNKLDTEFLFLNLASLWVRLHGSNPSRWISLFLHVQIVLSCRIRLQSVEYSLKICSIWIDPSINEIDPSVEGFDKAHPITVFCTRYFEPKHRDSCMWTHQHTACELHKNPILIILKLWNFVCCLKHFHDKTTTNYHILGLNKPWRPKE